ncbi:MAG TPA: transcriptional regulator NrdR [Myxococcota bacterium]|nr:transcriptional regulator NrdR [Myxococcota bacterium]
MRCPFCGEDQNKVLDSRDSDEGKAIRRRRECEKCERRFTTYERAAPEALPLVIKSDGRRQEFDREKVLRGLRRACEKRPGVGQSDLDRLVDEVERVMGARGEREVPSADIGELVMKLLKDLDHIAYVRYASVYRDFQDPEDFKQAVESLKGQGDETPKPPRER